jgi:peptide/nickel transport system permease protein
MAADDPRLAISTLLEDKALHDQVSLSLWQIAGRRLRRDRLTLLALAVVGTLALLSIFADVISLHLLHVDPNDTDLLATFEPPSSAHWLGTDQLGRDQLARLLVGGRISLAIGFAGAAMAMTLGVSIGMFAAFKGGRTDDFIMWFINTLQSVPTIFLLLIVVALFEPSAFWLTMIFGFLGWTGAARLVRGEVLSLREREFIMATVALGGSTRRILVRHVFPNVLPIVTVIAAIDVGGLILAESGLSYLGLGVQPPQATWGNMLTKSQQYRILGPHLVIFPGMLITVTVLCLYLIGDGLRDALDPRLQ